MLVVPITKNGGLFLGSESGVRAFATDVCGGEVEVVVPGDCDVEMDVPNFAAVGVWRAPVLLHDQSGPIGVGRRGDADQCALTASH